MYLVDTNVLSETRKGREAHPNVVAWNDATPEDALFVSVITIQEIETGILRLARRDPFQSNLLRTWLEGSVMPNFSSRILDVDLPIARRTAALHVPNPRPFLDALIAATALVHGLTIITRNTADFAPMGVRTLDPWTYAAS